MLSFVNLPTCQKGSFCNAFVLSVSVIHGDSGACFSRIVSCGWIKKTWLHAVRLGLLART